MPALLGQPWQDNVGIDTSGTALNTDPHPPSGEQALVFSGLLVWVLFFFLTTECFSFFTSSFFKTWTCCSNWLGSWHWLQNLREMVKLKCVSGALWFHSSCLLQAEVGLMQNCPLGRLCLSSFSERKKICPGTHITIPFLNVQAKPRISPKCLVCWLCHQIILYFQGHPWWSFSDYLMLRDV